MEDLTMPFHIKPGTLIAFEGLDATGKSTQMDRIEHDCYVEEQSRIFEVPPLFLHLPSGSNIVGDKVYEITESGQVLAPHARQLLHLAAHAQEVEFNIKPHLEDGGTVFLDRCWWSTIAYGGFMLPQTEEDQISMRRWRQMIKLEVWQGLKPDVVFLFMKPWVKDKHNTEHVKMGYESLAVAYNDSVCLIEPANEAETSLQIFEELARRGLYKNGE